MKQTLLAALLLIGGGAPAFAQTQPSQQPVTDRFGIGGEMTHRTGTAEDLSLGGFASYRILSGVYVDGAFRVFSGAVPVSTPYTTGRMTQILVGGKFGVKKTGYGLFAKLRVGNDRYSRVVTGTYPQTNLGPVDSTVIDIGGVFELHVARHVLLRFDGGEIYTRSGYLAREPHSLSLTGGAGWRF